MKDKSKKTVWAIDVTEFTKYDKEKNAISYCNKFYLIKKMRFRVIFYFFDNMIKNNIKYMILFV